MKKHTEKKMKQQDPWLKMPSSPESVSWQEEF